VPSSLPTCGHRDGNFTTLAGELENHWAISVSGNWRLTFKFEGEDAVLVDYQDYH